MEDLRLRPATEADFDLVYALKSAAMRPWVVATWGVWDEAVQRRRFSEGFRMPGCRIVQAGGIDIGILETHLAEGELVLRTIAIAPRHQARGIGTRLLTQLL